MIRANSRVTINSGMISRLNRASVRALEQTAEALHTEVVQAQVMPRDTGNLQNLNTFCEYAQSSRGIVQLISETPYARRLYYHPEYNFSTAENPHAQGKWFDPWISGSEKDFARNAFKEFYRRESGV